ncbi:MAG: T9SS type A sorting domain-containing protein [Chitinophagales bacterium]|nr:T9SS type A sorting domain-containing protein [Chitinophagales bacterium]
MKNLLLTFIVLLSCYYAMPTTAQVVLGGEQVVSAYNQQTTQLADMNNDGRQDLVSFSTTSMQIICYLNQGTSYWDNIYFLVDQQDFSEKIVLGDVNQDGWTDIICQQKQGLFWYRNMGAMHFADLQILCANCVTMNNYWTVEDMNTDNRLDVLSYDTTAVRIWYQTIDFQFNEPVIRTFQTVQNEINGDLQIRNLVGGFPKELIFRIGNSYKVFKQVGAVYQSVSFSWMLGEIKNIYFANFNNDEQLDVVVERYYSPELQVCFSSGNGFECDTLLQNQVTHNLAVGDINNDNQDDLVVLTSGIRMFSNNGDLTFTNSFWGNTFITSDKNVYLIDINDDSYLDVVMIEYNLISAFLLTNNNNLLQIPNQPLLHNDQTKLTMGDFDNDGNQDALVVMSQYLFAYYFDEQDRIRHIKYLHVSLPENVNLKSITTGDIDRDGDIDIVVGYGSTFQFARNNGDGTFANWTLLMNCLSCDNIVITDLNRDSLPDIVYTENTVDMLQCKVKVALQQNNNSFATPIGILTTSFGRIDDFHISESEADQTIDIVATSYNGLWWGQDFQGNAFANTSYFATPESAFIFNSAPIQLSASDEHAYIVSTNIGVMLYRLVSPDSLYHQTIWGTNTIYRITVMDINQDGLGDIVVQLQSMPGVDVLSSVACIFNVGMGNFSEPVANPIHLGPNIESIVRQKKGLLFNAVGRLYYCALFNAPSFAPHEIDLANGEISSIAAVDLDNDSWNDVVVASKSDNTVTWYKNLQNQSFAPPQIIATEIMGVTDMEVTDMNNDGLLDIIVAAPNADQILYFVNEGQGSFASPIVTNYLPEIKAIGVGDIDNNGSLDIISILPAEAQLYWHKFLGNGQYELIPIQTANTALSFPNQLIVEDIDADGFADIISASTIEGKINYSRYVGNDSFVTYRTQIINLPRSMGVGNVIGNSFIKEIFMVAASSNILFSNAYIEHGAFVMTDELGVKSIANADLNNDGNEDIIYGMDIEDKIKWVAGNKKGEFSLPIEISSDVVGGVVLATADLDNDGDQDIVSADLLSNRIIWHENMPNDVLHAPSLPPYSAQTTNIAQVFPNPAQDQLTIGFENPLHQHHYSLSNLWGQLLLEGQSNGQARTTIDLSHIETGLYLLQIAHDQQHQTWKIVKQ